MQRNRQHDPTGAWHSSLLGALVVAVVLFGGQSYSLCALIANACTCVAYSSEADDVVDGGAPDCSHCDHGQPAPLSENSESEDDENESSCTCVKVRPVVAEVVVLSTSAGPQVVDVLAAQFWQLLPVADEFSPRGEVAHAPPLRTPLAAGWLPPLRP